MTPGSVALAIGAGAQATLANLNFTGVGVTALSLGAGAVASLVGDSFAAGSTIALGQGAQLQLENTSIGAGLAGNGTVDVTGNVTLQAPGSLSGTIAYSKIMVAEGGSITGTVEIMEKSASVQEPEAKVVQFHQSAE